MSVVQPFKLALPGTSGQLERSRQLGALGQRLAGYPIVWLLGLPGAGKTSLAAQLLAQRQAQGEHAVWYRLDEDDADVAGIFDALRSGAPEPIRKALPTWSPQNQAELGTFARRFFARLAGAGRTVVVFDDCHRVADHSAFFEMLDAAREVCGDSLRLLPISRRTPPPLLARGALAGWLTVFDDLELSLDEAAQIAQRVSGRHWAAQEVESLRQAQGWLAHVLALAQSGTAVTGRVSSNLVSEYLAEELLRTLPAAERRGFRLLAELPEIPQALADGGPVAAAPARLLDDLAQRRYFVGVGVGVGAGTWRMHDLLRDGLRAQNQALESIAGLADARRGLAGWIARALPDAAMSLLVAAGDREGALALLRRHGRDWLERGRHRQLIAWTDSIAEPPGGDLPITGAELLLWRAEALLPLQPENARPLFAASRQALAAPQSAPEAYRAWCGEVASYVVQWGAVQGLAGLVDELERLVGALGEPPGDWAFRTAADALTALMYGRPEDPRLARYALATARALSHAPDAGSRIAAAAQLLIFRMWWAGDFPGGRALYDAFDAEVDAGEGLAPLPRLIWWSIASIVDWQCGDPARCYDKVERGLRLAEESGVHVRDFFLLTQGIFCALSQEDWPRAETYLQGLAQTERTHKRLDVMVHHFFRSWYCLCRGDARTALAHAETALPMAESLGSSFHMVIVLSALAPARLHSGDLAGAEAAYRRQLALAKAAGNPTFSFIAFCAGAEIALVRKDEPALCKQVERILMVKHLGGFHSGCGWRTPVMAELLAFALRQGILPEVARQWIREKRIPAPGGRAVAGWPMPVRVRALTGLEVEMARPAEAAASTRPPAKLRELLAVLVAARDGASQSDLCEWLWPDADGDRAAASLKVAVHRLRQWLGTEAVVVRNQKVSLNAAAVGCDLWECIDLRAPVAAHKVLTGFDAPPVLELRERLGK